MAQTGMEAVEILRGTAEQTHPDVILAVDALAACSIHRLNCTIQLADTGIWPGSGVGNHRNALNQETLGVPVIGIGVPTVVGQERSSTMPSQAFWNRWRSPRWMNFWEKSFHRRSKAFT